MVPHEAAQHLDVGEANAPREETLFLIHPQWMGTLRLYGDKAVRVDNGDRAQALAFDGQNLSLRWERWGEEHYRRQPDASFRLCENPA